MFGRNHCAQIKFERSRLSSVNKLWAGYKGPMFLSSSSLPLCILSLFFSFFRSNMLVGHISPSYLIRARKSLCIRTAELHVAQHFLTKLEAQSIQSKLLLCPCSLLYRAHLIGSLGDWLIEAIWKSIFFQPLSACVWWEMEHSNLFSGVLIPSPTLQW